MRARRHRILIGIALLLALVVGITDVGSAASTYQSGWWATDGDVTSSGEPVVNVPGATGSFRMGNLSNSGGPVSAATDDSGQITVYIQPGTKFYSDDDNNGSYTASTEQQVVVVGAHVRVSGKYQRNSSNAILLFANFVWSPPPTPRPATHRPPNPQPVLPRDAGLNRTFGVKAFTKNGGAYISGSVGWSKFWGFTIHNFTDYGCGSQPACHPGQIAVAHGNELKIYETPNTVYWLCDGIECRKTEDRYTVVEIRGKADGIRVSGRYNWDGFDWRFYANHVFAQPPTASAPGGPIGPYGSTVAMTDMGTFNPATNVYEGTQWQGIINPNGGNLASSNVTMNLNMWQTEDGVWEFTGTYLVQAFNNPTSLAGDIYGTVQSGTNPAALDAQVTVDQATGWWNGWTGFGTWSGSGAYTVGSTGAQDPPVEANAAFKWVINRPN
jgi:hypothetical protein